MVPQYRWLDYVFISFALQAFVFVSGYLMAYGETNSQLNISVFLKKKVLRLIVPTLVFLHVLRLDRWVLIFC